MTQSPHPAQEPAPHGAGVLLLETRVIHLARATARRTLMEAECARVALSPVAWDAVDAGDASNAARIDAMPDFGPWGRMGGHAKGCLLSHRDALTAFLAGPASHALILEDDVFLADDLPLWTATLGWWPAGAAVVKLERWRDDSLRVLLDGAPQVHSGRQLHRMRSRHSGTGGYIINRAGATRVLASDKNDLPIDHLLFNPLISAVARDLATWQVVPALIAQGNEPKQTIPTARRTTKPLGLKITRGLAELRALLALPRLLTGRAALHRIAWQSRIDIA